MRLFEQPRENDVTVYLLYLEKVFPLTAFVQRSADQQQRHGPLGRPLQTLSYIRDERLEILETFKEQNA